MKKLKEAKREKVINNLLDKKFKQLDKLSGGKGCMAPKQICLTCRACPGTCYAQSGLN